MRRLSEISLPIGRQGRQGARAGAYIIVTYFNPGHDDTVAFVTAGISGFVDNEATLDDVADAVKTVASGGRVLPTSMTSRLFSEMRRSAGDGEAGRETRLQVAAHVHRKRAQRS